MKLFLNEPIFFHLIHSCFKLYFGFRDGTRRKWDFFFVFIPCRLIALENCWIAASGKRGSSLWSRSTRPDIIRNDDSLSFHHHIVIPIYSNLNLFVVWNWKISELDVYISSKWSIIGLAPSFHEIPKQRPPSNDTCTAWNVSLNSLTYTLLLNSRENGSRQDQSPVVSLYPLHRLEGRSGSSFRGSTIVHRCRSSPSRIMDRCKRIDNPPFHERTWNRSRLTKCCPDKPPVDRPVVIAIFFEVIERVSSSIYDMVWLLIDNCPATIPLSKLRRNRGEAGWKYISFVIGVLGIVYRRE